MKKLITGTRGLLAAITIVGLVFGLAGYSEDMNRRTKR